MIPSRTEISDSDLISSSLCFKDSPALNVQSIILILFEKKLNNIALISVAKGQDRNSGREILHLKDMQINLPLNDSLLFFIQRVRDEAHRFAITAHRKRRRKQSLKSIFDDIQGIGPKRKKALMKHFGTINNIKYASFNELTEVKEITNNIAEKIYGFFHSH